MNPDDVVCRCNMVVVEDVQEGYSTVSHLPQKQACNKLEIGTRCGLCLMEDNPIVDIEYRHVIENILK